MPTITVRASRAEVVSRVRQAVALLAGKTSDPTGAVAPALEAAGVQALSLIKDAFVTKARGGTDAAGITWPRLTRRYVAYGRRHPGLNSIRKRAAAAGRPGRPLLTTKQDASWRTIFARTYRRLKAKGQDDRTAAGNAAALAWALVKRAGGKTILGEYGDTPVEVGRDTGRLLNSLSPGSGSPEQVLRGEPGGVVIGTNRPGAEEFHNRRPIWPDGDQWPEAWTRRVGETLGDGLGRVLAAVLGQPGAGA